MGMYDSVYVKCPNCGEESEFQSKSGDCFLSRYTLEDCPQDVLIDVNRHAPIFCDCGVSYLVDIKNRKAILLLNQKENTK